MFLTVQKGKKSALCSLERKRLEGIISEVSKTLMSIENGRTGNGSKAKEDMNRKEQRTVCQREFRSNAFVEQLPYQPAEKTTDIRRQYPNLECVFTLSQMNALWGCAREGTLQGSAPARRDWCISQDNVAAFLPEMQATLHH